MRGEAEVLQAEAVMNPCSGAKIELESAQNGDGLGLNYTSNCAAATSVVEIEQIEQIAD